MTPTLAEPLPQTEETVTPPASERQETWAASRASSQEGEKSMMAAYFANHDFLLQDGTNPSSPRDTAASFLVNQGTSPNAVAQACLQWIADHANQGPFHITWYSPGALLPATLYEFRRRNPQLSAATHVHLFPGTIDLQLQAQVGTEAQVYARNMRRRFSYMILSGHSFDWRTGVVRFHFDREIPIQRTCALLAATQKFLFFDSQKFSGEGEEGYSLWELLDTCNAVILYTVAARSDTRPIKAAFAALCAELLTTDPAESVRPEEKSLRLTIVGSDNTPSESFCEHGFLRKARGESSTSTGSVTHSDAPARKAGS